MAEEGPKASDAGTSNATSSQALSKSARKKLAKKERFQQMKLARRQRKKELSAAKREERRAERDARLQAMNKEEREKYFEQSRKVMEARTKALKEKRELGRHALKNLAKQRVCVDVEWAKSLTEKELASLAIQISYSYSTVRNIAEDGSVPLKLSVVGMTKELESKLTSVASGWDVWPIRVTTKSLLDEFNVKDMVYLTHDAEDVLESLDSEKVYIIGGMVDRNRLKGATKKKADEMGLKCARFNLDETITMEGTPVLTVNHCVDLLSHVHSGLSWTDAYIKVLPPRKGAQNEERKRKENQQQQEGT
eukprot:Plantae.Rhodophyta-Hildenbrandia_rubra.ctg310.p1 GENE.Plantae.Rhodophyta-Hildenbrandia_rubra.ctg310~~Plantae.Rhodophyta-Hildenbrandia_rubra.ctg310.p1  ORF type:complete len:307 (-),score=71.70 Plantae.Rhodophyta-Hildenbrandia_rubra.ctg310:447-1367(-)